MLGLDEVELRVCVWVLGVGLGVWMGCWVV
jgi:hypothetical protein